MCRGHGRVMRAILDSLERAPTHDWLGIDELAGLVYETTQVTKAHRVAVSRAIRRLDALGLVEKDKDATFYPAKVAVRHAANRHYEAYPSVRDERRPTGASGELNPAERVELLKLVQEIFGTRASRALQFYLQGKRFREIADEMDLLQSAIQRTLDPVFVLTSRSDLKELIASRLG